MEPQEAKFPSSARAYGYLLTLVVAYVGVYLCRKNISVAVPILQTSWGINKEQVGRIASISTVAYASGKFIFGPITDRLGGRTALIGSMILTALFGAATALSPSLLVLTILYSASRLCGSASWGGMLKLLPDWFPAKTMPFVCGILSLSFVFGGAIGLSFGGLVGRLTHDSWPAILAVPALLLVLLAAGCWLTLPKPKRETFPGNKPSSEEPVETGRILELFRQKQFLVVVSLSFTLTLLRETFNFWTVDFIRTEAGTQISNSVAAYLSTPFDLCGAAGILFTGWIFGRLRPAGRRKWVVSSLVALSLLLALLPELFHLGVWLLVLGIGLIGFLVYGPYSLLAGVLSVEVRGKGRAATVSGIVDGTGYIAGYLSGSVFGRLLMIGGYRLGFEILACLTLVSAVMACFLYSRPASASYGGDAVAPARCAAAVERL
jgi:OPA family glycerol-3-phosphate transporter-like MFS transporter